MINPLEQFRIKELFQFKIGHWDIALTNSALAMILTVVVIFTLFSMALKAQKDYIPNRLQAALEMVYEFVGHMVDSNLGRSGHAYFPFILTLFLFVLFGNTLGMIPGTYTFTSQIIVTFTLALFVFVSTTLIGLFKHGFHFFSFFLPKGTPWVIAPLLVPVEILSFLSRPVSLAVRLFANMVAGHAVMKIFATFALILGSMKALSPLAILPLGVDVIMTGFEFFVCFLQAYVFAVLSCIYLNDMLELH